MNLRYIWLKWFPCKKHFYSVFSGVDCEKSLRGEGYDYTLKEPRYIIRCCFRCYEEEPVELTLERKEIAP